MIQRLLASEPVIAGIAAEFVALVVIAFGLDIPADQVGAMATIMGVLSVGLAYAVRWAVKPIRKRER